MICVTGARAVHWPTCTHGDGLLALQSKALSLSCVHKFPQTSEKDSRLEVLALLRGSDTWVRVEVVTTLDRVSDGNLTTGLSQAVAVIPVSV